MRFITVKIVYIALELGESDRQRNDIHEIRPRTRRGRLEMIENSTPRPKTRRGRKEGPGKRKKLTRLQNIQSQMFIKICYVHNRLDFL